MVLSSLSSVTPQSWKLGGALAQCSAPEWIHQLLSAPFQRPNCLLKDGLGSSGASHHAALFCGLSMCCLEALPGPWAAVAAAPAPGASFTAACRSLWGYGGPGGAGTSDWWLARWQPNAVHGFEPGLELRRNRSLRSEGLCQEDLSGAKTQEAEAGGTSTRFLWSKPCRGHGERVGCQFEVKQIWMKRNIQQPSPDVFHRAFFTFHNSVSMKIYLLFDCILFYI